MTCHVFDCYQSLYHPNFNQQPSHLYLVPRLPVHRKFTQPSTHSPPVQMKSGILYPYGTSCSRACGIRSITPMLATDNLISPFSSRFICVPADKQLTIRLFILLLPDHPALSLSCYVHASFAVCHVRLRVQTHSSAPHSWILSGVRRSTDEWIFILPHAMILRLSLGM